MTHPIGDIQIPLDQLNRIVRAALQEDIGTGDLTTKAALPGNPHAIAKIIFKERAVLAGLDPARLTFAATNPAVEFYSGCSDGNTIDAGAVIATIAGAAHQLLAAERTALNFLQRLSGIATLTRRFVDTVERTGAGIFDTRKTTPTLRALEKYAVRVGGGASHRMGLYDAVLIKDNHIALAGGVRQAVESAKKNLPDNRKIEVEVSSLDEVYEALNAGANLLLLDNMALPLLRKAVTLINGRAVVEVSGGVTLENVRAIADLGVQRISVGALTHSPRAIDVSMKIAPLD